MTTPKQTPSQIQQTKLRESTGSKFVRVIPSYEYHPTPKPPSRRDLIRAGERTRKL